MRIFAGDRVVAMMRAMGLQEDEAIEHKMVSRSIENAQRKVEARNFDIRKTCSNMMMLTMSSVRLFILSVTIFSQKIVCKIILKRCIAMSCRD